MSAREISSSRRSPPESTPARLPATAREPVVLGEHAFRGFARAFRARHQEAAHPQVLLDGHVGEHRVVLQDVGDAGARELLVGREPRHVRAAHDDPSRLDAREAVDRVQHGRLAGSVRADEAERLSRRHAQAHAVQDLHAAVAGDEVVQGEEWCAERERIQGRGIRDALGHARRGHQCAPR